MGETAEERYCETGLVILGVHTHPQLSSQVVKRVRVQSVDVTGVCTSDMCMLSTGCLCGDESSIGLDGRFHMQIDPSILGRQ